VPEWRTDPGALLAAVGAAPWASGRVIVRSSARDEDRAGMAGRYDSVAGVAGSAAIRQAIERVIASFIDGTAEDQVFVQPMLDRVAMAGVVFSRCPVGGPYFVVNLRRPFGPDGSRDGRQRRRSQNILLRPVAAGCVSAGTCPVIATVQELETLLGRDSIDVEFAVGEAGEIYLLQVRPLAVEEHDADADATVDAALVEVAQGGTSQPSASLSARRSCDFRRDAGLESCRDHRCTAVVS
jgi:hypothetical protein